MTLEESLREEYGDELLESLATHYPRQFEHIVRLKRYYMEPPTTPVIQDDIS